MEFFGDLWILCNPSHCSVCGSSLKLCLPLFHLFCFASVLCSIAPGINCRCIWSRTVFSTFFGPASPWLVFSKSSSTCLPYIGLFFASRPEALASLNVWCGTKVQSLLWTNEDLRNAAYKKSCPFKSVLRVEAMEKQNALVWGGSISEDMGLTGMGLPWFLACQTKNSTG